MSIPLPPVSSPRALLADLRAFWRERPRHHIAAAALALAIPAIILIGFWLDTQTNIAPGPRIHFYESWPATRTDAEIIAKQQRDLALRRQAEAERQRQFQKLDSQMNRLGI